MTSLRAYISVFVLSFVLVAGLVVPAALAQDQGQSRTQQLSIQFHRAETAWRSGANLLEAKVRLDHVLNEMPDDIEARKLRAQVLLGLGRASEAFEDAEHAAELAPEDGEARLIHAETARHTGRHDLAREELEAAGEFLMEDASIHLRVSWNAALLGQFEKAEAYARTALALDPTDVAYYQLARVFVWQEESDQAAAILERGFSEQMVEASVIQRDSLLRQVSDHEAIRSYMRPR